MKLTAKHQFLHPRRLMIDSLLLDFPEPREYCRVEDRFPQLFGPLPLSQLKSTYNLEFVTGQALEMSLQVN